MRASTSFLAGAGTVIVAMAMGLGGGLMMGNIMSPHEMRAISKAEQRSAAGPQQAQQSPQPASHQNGAATITAADGPQTQSPYLAATQQAATAPVVVSPAPANPPPAGANHAATKPAPPTDNVTASSDPPAKPKPVEASATSQQATAPATHEQNPSSENAYAKARDADLKRADEKRKADRAGRKQQWAARRQQQREQELRNVEASVREDADQPREIIVRRDDSRDDFRRNDSDRPMRMGFPRFNLFDQD
jgi:hypothetical protein